MHADLMGAAGFEPARQQTRHRRAQAAHFGSADIGFSPAVALEHLPMGDRLPAALADGHAVAGDFVPVDRPVDRAARPLRRTPDESQVAALEWPAIAAMARKLIRQAFMGAVIFGNDHQAGGVLVEPVNDARASLAADAGKA